MMQRNIIWVTGSAASGKTTFIEYFTQKFEFPYFLLTDAQEMLELNELDSEHKHHIHPKGEEGFLLTSNYHFDESIRRLVAKSEKELERFLIIEVARGKGSNLQIDLSFKRFLELVSPDIWNRSILIYLKASLDTRKARNDKRRKNNFASGVERESFYVPSNALEQFFLEDDFEEVRDTIPCPLYVVNNGNLERDQLQSIAENVRGVV